MLLPKQFYLGKGIKKDVCEIFVQPREHQPGLGDRKQFIHTRILLNVYLDEEGTI